MVYLPHGRKGAVGDNGYQDLRFNQNEVSMSQPSNPANPDQPSDAEGRQAYEQICAALDAGQMPTEIEGAWYVTMRQSDLENPDYALLAHQRAMDKGAFSQSTDYVRVLAIHAEQLPPDDATLWYKELAFVYGWVIREMRHFAVVFGHVQHAIDFSHPMDYRVQAAQHRIMGDVEQVKEILAQGLSALSGDDDVVARREHRILEHLQRQDRAIEGP